MPAVKRSALWTGQAEQDLRLIWRYYAREGGVDVADKWFFKLIAGGARIAERPRTWRARDDIAAGLRVFRVAPYGLYYRVTLTGPQILRVLHERQNLPAILRNLRDTADGQESS